MFYSSSWKRKVLRENGISWNVKCIPDPYPKAQELKHVTLGFDREDRGVKTCREAGAVVVNAFLSTAYRTSGKTWKFYLFYPWIVW